MQFDKSRNFCALCKQWYPRHLFMTSNRTPTQVDIQRLEVLRHGYGDLGGPGMLELPGDLCLWHLESLVTISACVPEVTPWTYSRALERFSHSKSRDPIIGRDPGWYSWIRKWCMHCDMCYVHNNHSCCDTCSTRDVRIYHRFVGKDEERGKVHVIWRDSGGTMWAREWNGEFSTRPNESFLTNACSQTQTATGEGHGKILESASWTVTLSNEKEAKL